jgi:hypothetical protein
VDVPEAGAERLVRTRKRVADHGEVFTPRWLVEDMLDLVKSETERIDSRVLEPACGSGNFLVPVLERKLASVRSRYGSSDFEKRNYALLGLMCVYGIELLADNAQECRERLLSIFTSFLTIRNGDAYFHAAERVLALNIVEGDALSMVDSTGEHITFPEWAYLGRGQFQRRDFRFDDLTQRSSVDVGLFTHFQEQDVFVPVRSFPAMSVEELAA